MPDEVVAFKVTGSQEAIQSFKATAQALQGITLETAKAGTALKASTESLTAARQGFTALSQVVSRAGDVARLFGVDISGVERAVVTVTSTLATGAAAWRTYAGAVGVAQLRLLGIVGLFAAATVAIDRFAQRMGLQARGVEQVWAEAAAGVGGAAKRLLEIREGQERWAAMLPAVTHAAREHGQTVADIFTASVFAARGIAQLEEIQRREAAAAQRAAEAAGRHAAALVEQARAAHEAAEELADVIRWERIQDEVLQVAVPRATAMVQALQGVVLEVRDYIIQARAAAEATEDFSGSLGDILQQMSLFQLEADMLGGAPQDYHQRLRAIIAEGPEAAAVVANTEAERAILAMIGLADQMASEFTETAHIASQAGFDLGKALEQQFGALGPYILDTVAGIGDAVGTLLGDIADTATSLAEDISHFFSNVGDAILQTIQRIISSAAVAGLISLISGGRLSFGTVFGALTGITGLAQGGIVPGPLIPVPAFQGGGIARTPMLAAVGEGGPEAVVPLMGGRIPVELTGRREQEIVVNIGIVLDRSQLARMGPGDVITVSVDDIVRRGAMFRAIKAVVDR